MCTHALNLGVGLPAGNTCSVLAPAGPGGMELHQSHLDWATSSVIIILHTVVPVEPQGTDNLCSWAWPGGTAGITGIFVQEGKREK